MAGQTPQSVGLLAKVPYLDTVPELVLLPIRDVPKDFRTIYMIYNQEGFKSHAVMLLINYIRENYSLLTK